MDDDEEEDMEGTGAEGVVAGSSEASSPRISAKAKRIVRTKQVWGMCGDRSGRRVGSRANSIMII